MLIHVSALTHFAAGLKQESLPSNLHLKQAWFHKKEAEELMNATGARYNPDHTLLISYSQNITTRTIPSQSVSGPKSEGGSDGDDENEAQSHEGKEIVTYENNVLKDMSDQVRNVGICVGFEKRCLIIDIHVP